MRRLFLLRWLAGAVILVFVLLQADPSDLGEAITRLDAATWVGVVALNALVLLLAGLRSRLVLRRMGHTVSAPVLFSSVTLGFVAGSLTPAASGELLRADALRTRAGVPLRDGAALIVFERLLSFYLMVVSAAAAAAVLLLPGPAAVATVALLGLAVGAPVFGGTVLRLLPQTAGEPANLRQRIVHYARSTLERMEGLFDDRGMLATWSLTTFATFGAIAFQFWLLSQGLGGGLSLVEALFAYGGSQVLSILTFLPLGLGVSDGSLAEIAVRSGMARNDAIGLAVLVRSTIMAPLIAVAVASYVYLIKGRAPQQPAVEPPA
jgi:glycosyltransferase 2 family protein